MVNLRARWYEPSTMRFSQRDVWHGAQIIPQSQNRYLYCVNDPANLLDKSGDAFMGMHAGVRLPISKPIVDQTKKNPGLRKSLEDSAKKLAALMSTGIDKSGLNDAQRKVVEEAEKELLHKAIDGTLSESERSRIIQGACTSIKLYDGGFHINGDSVYWDGVKYTLSKPALTAEEWETVYQRQLYDGDFNAIKGLYNMGAEDYPNPNNKYKRIKGLNAFELAESFVLESIQTEYANVSLQEKGANKRAIILLANSDYFTKYAGMDFEGRDSLLYSAWVEQYGTFGMYNVSESARKEYEAKTQQESKWWLAYDYLISIDAQHQNELYSQYLVKEAGGNLIVKPITYPKDQVMIAERTWLGLDFNILIDVSDRLAAEETLVNGKEEFERWMKDGKK